MVVQKTHDLDKEDVKVEIFKINSVMDYYSNEFLRVENFLEKYLPLKV